MEVDHVISPSHEDHQHVVTDDKPEAITDAAAHTMKLDTPNSTNSRTENSKQHP